MMRCKEDSISYSDCTAHSATRASILRVPLPDRKYYIYESHGIHDGNICLFKRYLPAATDDSEMIRKGYNDDIFVTCVPPQSSIEWPPIYTYTHTIGVSVLFSKTFSTVIHTCTTRTTPPYFSLNNAIAPDFIASSYIIS